MEQWLDKIDIDVYICLDKEEAQGLEKKMIDVFNGIDFDTPIKELKLNKNQIMALKMAQPISRFWKIKELDGIGITCYTRLFEYCKNYNDMGGFDQISFKF